MRRKGNSKQDAAKIKKKFGKDFFREIGRKGGKSGWYGKGFASELLDKNGLEGRQRAAIYGNKGKKRMIKKEV